MLLDILYPWPEQRLVYLARVSNPGSPSTLRKGHHKLFLWPWTEADGSFKTETPSKVPNASALDALERVFELM